jgi:hypothetical protein
MQKPRPICQILSCNDLEDLNVCDSTENTLQEFEPIPSKFEQPNDEKMCAAQFN